MGLFGFGKKKKQEEVAEEVAEEVKDLSKHKSKKVMHESSELEEHLKKNYGWQNFAVKNFWHDLKTLEEYTKNMTAHEIAYDEGKKRFFFKLKDQIERSEILNKVTPMKKSCEYISEDIQDISHLLKKYVPKKEIKIYRELKHDEKDILETVKEIIEAVKIIQEQAKYLLKGEGEEEENEVEEPLKKYHEALKEAVEKTEELIKDLSDANYELRRISDDNKIFYKEVEEHLKKLDGLGKYNGRDNEKERELHEKEWERNSGSFTQEKRIIGTEARSGLGKYTVKNSVKKHLKEKYGEDIDEIISKNKDKAA